MDKSHSEIIRYFNACYQADNREQTVWNIFSADHDHLNLMAPKEAETLIAGDPFSPEKSYGERLAHSVRTYRREKTLIAGFIFISGRVQSLSALSRKSKKICAPLIIGEVSIDDSGNGITASAAPSEFRWNTGLLQLILSDNNDLSAIETAFDLAGGRFPEPETIGQWLKDRGTETRIASVENRFTDEATLKKHSGRRKESGLVISGGSALFLAKRSRSSRGIIDELDQVETATTISNPLALLCHSFGGEPVHPKGKCRPENVPGILSDVQERSLKNAADETLSMLIGPPGTGKSYTIACIALERFLAGESVLIVSENEHAVDVIQEKLVEQLGVSASAVVRAGSSNYHKQLISTIENLTRGIGVEDPGTPVDKPLEKKRAEIRKREKRFITLSEKGVKDGIYLDRHLSAGRVGFPASLMLWLQKRRNRKHGLLHEQLNTIQMAYRDREQLLAEKIDYQYRSAVRKILTENRGELVTFLQALKARTSSKQERMFSEMDYGLLLKTMPVWLCSISALSRALPLSESLFDLVIIDEATQCDIASAIPAVFRAKRAVVCGDPKQLRHVSFLSRKKQAMLAEKAGVSELSGSLDFREHSMIDFADQAIRSQEAVTMLDEHYRSLPEIIRFSNEYFYHNSLRIMTEKPGQQNLQPVEIIKVSDGQRENGINRPEIDALMHKLDAIINSQKEIPAKYKASIGILSFFRDQTEALQSALVERFPMDLISGHKLRAGTPYAFQGEERDIMMISCCVGNNEKSGTWTYLNREDVFNVAVTRARYSQYLFLSADFDAIPGNALLKSWLQSFENGASERIADRSQRDKNIDELAGVLSERGLNVIKAFPVAGIPMDMVVTAGDAALAVDVIGFPGEYQDAFDLGRYRIFERAGMPIFPLTYTSFVYNREDVVDTIVQTVEKLADQKQQFLITKDTLTSHWHKLLSVNPALAKKVRHLELSLAMEGLEDAVAQTGLFVERYHRFLSVLQEKLNPGEITWSRYVSAAEQLLMSGLANLESVLSLRKSMPENDDGSLSDQIRRQADEIGKLIAANETALQKLGEITLEWGRIDTGLSSESVALSDSLSEIERLIHAVKNYHTGR